MTVTNTLSCAPLSPDQEDDVLHNNTKVLISAMIRALCSPEKQQQPIGATTNDRILQRIIHF